MLLPYRRVTWNLDLIEKLVMIQRRMAQVITSADSKRSVQYLHTTGFSQIFMTEKTVHAQESYCCISFRQLKTIYTSHIENHDIFSNTVDHRWDVISIPKLEYGGTRPMRLFFVQFADRCDIRTIIYQTIDHRKSYSITPLTRTLKGNSKTVRVSGGSRKTGFI